jgi:uncharacterized protein
MKIKFQNHSIFANIRFLKAFYKKMKIDLKKKLNLAQAVVDKVLMDERLPAHVVRSFEMNYRYDVQDKGEFYLLNIKENAMIPIYCQRCMQEFSCDYTLESELAICPSEQIAEKYQSLYDVIVVSDAMVDFKEILIDNLHLFSPQFHQTIEDCDSEQLKLIQND